MKIENTCNDNISGGQEHWLWKRHLQQPDLKKKNQLCHLLNMTLGKILNLYMPQFSNL